MRRFLSADWHIGKNTVDEDDLFRVFYHMMEQAVEHKCTHFDILGDLLDNRSLMMFRLWPRVQKFFEELADTGMRVTVMAGNHDQYGTELRALSNLRYVNLDDRVHIVDHIITDSDGVTWVPWLFEGETIPTDGEVVFAHLPFNGFRLNNWKTEEDGIDIPQGSTAPIFTGHFHTPQSKGNIRYLGSVIHHTWNDANDRKYAWILEADFTSIQAVPLNAHFRNLVKVDYMDLETMELAGPARVTVTGVPLGTEKLVVEAMKSRGAISVECTNPEQDAPDNAEEETISCMTVDQAIMSQIETHELQPELEEMHRGMS